MAQLTAPRVRHAVIFRLAHPAGSPEEADFLGALADLERIPGVEAFQLLREVSAKNAFTFGLTMEFADQAAYDAYDAHSDHQRFVAERWLAEVAEFLETDTAPL